MMIEQRHNCAVRICPDSPHDAGGNDFSKWRSHPFQDYPDLLSVNNLCEITGQSAQTIRALINAGKIPGCRIGRRLYVSKAEFLGLIERGLA